MSELNVTLIENEADSTAVQLNRKATDGSIIDLQKDNSPVGSIGVVNNNNPFISNDADNSGLQFGTNQIIPHYDNLQRDNAVDLGSSSVRFKDLYLSGGVYLGGTGAANYLDDYEEGTFTPTLIGGFSSAPTSYESQSGSYVKIGRFVYFQLTLDAVGAVADGSGVSFSGLPFTSVSAGASHGGAFINYQTSFNTNAGDRFHFNGANTRVSMYNQGGGARGGNESGVNINNLIVLTGVYLTDA